MEDKTLMALAGTLIGLLIAIIAYFIKREMASLDKAKEKKGEEEKTLNETLQEISSSIIIMKSKMESFTTITSEIEEIHNKLNTMEKDGNNVRHEIELLAQMIKPLFDMKHDFSRAQQDIVLIFTKMDTLKEFLHRMEKEVIVLKEKE